MNETTPKISVIVPVYKAEAYLHRCVDSILAQTFQDFEVLLIDDGSPDRSGEICDEYARKDRRVRVFHKENGGVSSARNVGLDNARGENVCFVDSDDWVEVDMLATICSFFQSKKQIDLLFWGFQYDYSQVQNDKKRKEETVLQYVYCDTAESILQSCCWLEEREMFGWTGNKLFRREIIQAKGVRFDETVSLQEDHLFTLDYIRYVKNLMVVPYYPYHYRIVNDSLMNKQRTYEDLKKTRDLLLRHRIALCEIGKANSCDNVDMYKIYTYNSFAWHQLGCLPLLFTKQNPYKKIEVASFRDFLNQHRSYLTGKLSYLAVVSIFPNRILDTLLYVLFKLYGKC